MLQDNQLVEVVDFDGKFHANFHEMFSSLGLLRSGMGFNVVTVLGCQSSGKSTLLNAMFHTKFPEMDSMAGRGQTTKGIWCSRDYESKTLVIDVEGTDSKERGEDRLTFEHRASLFSLAIADAVIVNMWYHDIGRYTASNYGLLKTVFAVMLELFYEDGSSSWNKTHMIFVIRDHSPRVTPIEKLERMILRDVEGIWKDIKKPLHLKSSTPDDFFEFSVVGLPNRLEDIDQFSRESRRLKDLWLHQIAPASYSRAIPADGFPMYAESVWTTIMNSQQLDIPSQKEMVATYRCEEIKAAISKAAATLFSKHVVEAANPSVVNALFYLGIVFYHKNAWRYDTKVYEKKRAELEEFMVSMIQKHFDQSLNKKRQSTLKAAQAKLQQLARKNLSANTMEDGVSSIFDWWANLDNVIADWRTGVVNEFVGAAESLGEEQKRTDTIEPIDVTADLNADVAGVEDFNTQSMVETVARVLSREDAVQTKTAMKPSAEGFYHHFHKFGSEFQVQLLNENLDETESHFRQGERNVFIKLVDGAVTTGLRQEIELLQLEPSLDAYWERATDIFKATVSQQAGRYEPALEGILGRFAEDPLTTRDHFALLVYQGLYDNMNRRADRIAELVYERFKKFFETDEDGVPHYWATAEPEKIRTTYKDARKKAAELHPFVGSFGIEVAHILSDPALVRAVPESVLRLRDEPFLDSARQAETFATADRFMLKSCQEAQFIQATGGKVTSGRWWMWLLMLVLGWNELMALYRSPIFVITALTTLLVAAGAYYTGNLFRLITIGRFTASHMLGAVLPLLQQLQQQGVAIAQAKEGD